MLNSQVTIQTLYYWVSHLWPFSSEHDQTHLNELIKVSGLLESHMQVKVGAKLCSKVDLKGQS